MASALHAENSLQTFKKKLKNVVAFPRGTIKDLVSSSNDDATNNEPFCAAHDEQCKEDINTLALNF